MMLDSNSDITVAPCTCAQVPIPHAYVSVDWGESVYGPIYSHEGFKKVVETAMENDDFTQREHDEALEYLHQLPLELPLSHAMDVMTNYTEPIDLEKFPLPPEVNLDEELDEEFDGQASFVLCFFCGKHGTLYHKSGKPLASARSKRQAKEALNYHSNWDEVDYKDFEKVAKEIEESGLPNEVVEEEDSVDSELFAEA